MSADEIPAARALPTVVFLGGSVALAAVLFRLWLFWPVHPSVFWDTESYLRYARWIARHLRPRYGSFRTPGYPLFLLMAGGRHLSLGRVVAVQTFLGVACNVFVTVALWNLTRRRSMALLGGLASMLAISVTFLEVTIYAETLARFLVTLALASFAAATCRSRSGIVPLLAGATSVGLVPLVRPALVVAIPVTIILFGYLAWRKVFSFRALCAACLLAILPVGLLVGRNLVREHFLGLSRAIGQSVLDAAGDPVMYRNLPPELGGIRRVYEQAALELRTDRVPAWEAAPRLEAFERREGRIYPNTDALERSIAWRCIRAAPLAFARIWADAFRRFFCDEDLLFGFYETPGQAGTRPQVGGMREKVVVGLDRFWRIGVPAVTILAVIILPIRIAWARGSADRVSTIALWAWGACLAVALINTALETSPGQARYRAPLSDALIVLAVVGTSMPARALRRRPVVSP